MIDLIRPSIGSAGDPVGRPLVPFPLSNLATERGEQDSLRVFLNDTAGGVGKGAVVILSTTARSFNVSSTQDAAGIVGVALESIASGKPGAIAIMGKVAEVQAIVGVTAGQYLRQSTTSGQAGGTTNATAGTFGIALTSRDATTGMVEAILLGQALMSVGATFTGQTIFADGSAAAPSITFTGALTTGLYQEDSDSIDFATSGVHRVKISTAGQTLFERGTAGAPPVAFRLDTATGIDNDANTLYLTAAGVREGKIDGDGLTLVSNLNLNAASWGDSKLSWQVGASEKWKLEQITTAGDQGLGLYSTVNAKYHAAFYPTEAATWLGSKVDSDMFPQGNIHTWQGTAEGDAAYWMLDAGDSTGEAGSTFVFARQRYNPIGVTTLNGAINASATTINFTTTAANLLGTSRGNMILIIGTEQIMVNRASATSFAVVTNGRGYNGTTAASHSDLATITVYGGDFGFTVGRDNGTEFAWRRHQQPGTAHTLMLMTDNFSTLSDTAALVQKFEWYRWNGTTGANVLTADLLLNQTPTFRLYNTSAVAQVTLNSASASVFAQGISVSGGSLDMGNNLITNIGNAGTDFTSGGGLTLAAGLTVTTGGITVSAGDVTLTRIDFSGATGTIFGGSSQIIFRNNADSATNLTIADAGGITIRGQIDMSAISAGSSNLKITATSDTPTVTWGAAAGNEASTAPAGYLEIDVGGNARYIPFWA